MTTIKEDELPTSMEMGVYWYVDEDTKEVVFDEDSMREEFDSYLSSLEAKYKGVKIETND